MTARERLVCFDHAAVFVVSDGGILDRSIEVIAQGNAEPRQRAGQRRGSASMHPEDEYDRAHERLQCRGGVGPVQDGADSRQHQPRS